MSHFISSQPIKEASSLLQPLAQETYKHSPLGIFKSPRPLDVYILLKPNEGMVLLQNPLHTQGIHHTLHLKAEDILLIHSLRMNPREKLL